MDARKIYKVNLSHYLESICAKLSETRKIAKMIFCKNDVNTHIELVYLYIFCICFFFICCFFLYSFIRFEYKRCRFFPLQLCPNFALPCKSWKSLAACSGNARNISLFYRANVSLQLHVRHVRVADTQFIAP